MREVRSRNTDSRKTDSRNTDSRKTDSRKTDSKGQNSGTRPNGRLNDLTGRRLGKVTVVEKPGQRAVRHSAPYNKRDLTGQRFGRLLALYPMAGSPKSVWHCRCDCGNEADVFADNLVRGLTRSSSTTGI